MRVCLFSTDRIKQVSQIDVILLSLYGVSFSEVQEGLKSKVGVHCFALASAFISHHLPYYSSLGGPSIRPTRERIENLLCIVIHTVCSLFL